MEEMIGRCEKCNGIITVSMPYKTEMRKDSFDFPYAIRWHEKCYQSRPKPTRLAPQGGK